MPKIRALIVDDSIVIRRLLTDTLSADPEIEVVGVAPNGHIALAKLSQVNPDVVTLDIEMPEMDGLSTLRELRKTYPKLPVIMCSTLTQRGAVATLDALSLGASDYVTKPANVGSVAAALQTVANELIPKIKALCRRDQPQPEALRPVIRAPLPRPPAATAGARVDIIAIGISTGGPNALAEMLPRLPADLPVPVVIVQHMPPMFTKYLADRLDRISALRVREAAGGEPLVPGTIWIAPGDHHLVVARSGTGVVTRLNQDPPENSCRPAVDVLFRSVSEVYRSSAVAAVLTGMGQDGLRGCEEIHHRGGRTIAQDEATSVVWGMPGAVIRAGLADQVLPLDQIGSRLAAMASRHAAPAPGNGTTASRELQSQHSGR